MKSPLLSASDPRLIAGVGLAALLATAGLISSQPAHSTGGPTPVIVANTPLSVVTQDSDNSARNAVGNRITLSSVTAGATLSGTLFTVPAGKRLIIEHLSSSTNRAGDPNGYNIEVDTIQHGATVATYFNEVPDAAPYSAASQPVRLYGDPGTTVKVTVYPSNKGTSDLNLSFSGSLENQ